MVCLVAPVTNDSDVQNSQKQGSVCFKRGVDSQPQGVDSPLSLRLSSVEDRAPERVSLDQVPDEKHLKHARGHASSMLNASHVAPCDESVMSRHAR
eukprot:1177297-Prorocentrum_minimum.AAC.3